MDLPWIVLYGFNTFRHLKDWSQKHTFCRFVWANKRKVTQCGDLASKSCVFSAWDAEASSEVCWRLFFEHSQKTTRLQPGVDEVCDFSSFMCKVRFCLFGLLLEDKLRVVLFRSETYLDMPFGLRSRSHSKMLYNALKFSCMFLRTCRTQNKIWKDFAAWRYQGRFNFTKIRSWKATLFPRKLQKLFASNFAELIHMIRSFIHQSFKQLQLLEL